MLSNHKVVFILHLCLGFGRWVLGGVEPLGLSAWRLDPVQVLYPPCLLAVEFFQGDGVLQVLERLLQYGSPELPLQDGRWGSGCMGPSSSLVSLPRRSCVGVLPVATNAHILDGAFFALGFGGSRCSLDAWTLLGIGPRGRPYARASSCLMMF